MYVSEYEYVCKCMYVSVYVSEYEYVCKCMYVSVYEYEYVCECLRVRTAVLCQYQFALQ